MATPSSANRAKNLKVLWQTVGCLFFATIIVGGLALWGLSQMQGHGTTTRSQTTVSATPSKPAPKPTPKTETLQVMSHRVNGERYEIIGIRHGQSVEIDATKSAYDKIVKDYMFKTITVIITIDDGKIVGIK